MQPVQRDKEGPHQERKHPVVDCLLKVDARDVLQVRLLLRPEVELELRHAAGRDCDTYEVPGDLLTIETEGPEVMKSTKSLKKGLPLCSA